MGSRHPLIERASQKEVRQAKGFREAAAAMTGEALLADYEAERSGAPRRREAGKKHLANANKRLSAERKAGRDSEHAALALVQHRRAAENGLMLPEDEGLFDALHAGVVLKSAPADKSLGVDDPNYGIDRADLMGIGPEDRLAVVCLRYLAPDAGRVGTGDTPLRALLEGLAQAAVVEANRDALVEELSPLTDRPIGDAKPTLMLLGSPRYWELCRKREAQRGAAWIKELERLAKEIDEQLGMAVRFLSLRVSGNPGWSYQEGGPVFEGQPRLIPAWEHGAGRVKPKPKARARRSSVQPADLPVEADLSRPVRGYALTEHYTAGDRIEHPTLGLGVVQGLAGSGKIRVLFDERKSVLVHDRPAPAAS